MSVSACKKLFFLTPGGHSWLIPLTLCLSMELRKSRSVWSEIPPWTIRIFPSITVAMGRRLKTSWNSWRISRPWVCKQARTVILKKSAVTVTKLQSAYWVVDIKKKKSDWRHVFGLYLVLLHDFLCEPVSEKRKQHTFKPWYSILLVFMVNLDR